MNRLVLTILVLAAAYCAEGQRVWLREDAAKRSQESIGGGGLSLHVGDVVTVEYSGYQNFSYCRVNLVDPYNQIVLQTNNAACKTGFARFKLRQSGPFVIQAGALMYDGWWSLFAADMTVHNVQSESDSKKRHRRDGLPFYYYNYDEGPEGSRVWIDGDPTVLTPHEHIVVMYEGLDDFNTLLITFVMDDGSILCIDGEGWAGYAHFTKVNTPYSATAYFEVWVLDDDTKLPLFRPISTADSFVVLADTNYQENRRRLQRELSRDEERNLLLRGMYSRRSYTPRDSNWVKLHYYNKQHYNKQKRR